MSKEITQSVSSESESKTKSQRELAWQVAPNLLVSFKYAWQGVRYAYASQRNFRIHVFVAIIAFSLGFILQVTTTEMAIITLTVAIVLVLELLNTAIESVVDLTVKQSYHELAKIAKDCAAGAVLIAALTACMVAGYILLPHVFQLTTVN